MYFDCTENMAGTDGDYDFQGMRKRMSMTISVLCRSLFQHWTDSKEKNAQSHLLYSPDLKIKPSHQGLQIDFQFL